MQQFLSHCRQILRIDVQAQEALSDLLVNLSAGWFGTIVISPVFVDLHALFAMIILSFNALLGTLSPFGAIVIRRRSTASFSPLNA
ncbi:hypothetical protein COU79_01090 [Candidatus Peregrinibacteria bacterium CG10_big_fil_rev_8_21_14_0_10_54_7]|nr:MAG: hypothetical protein COU79_01090 [Candidatus Peregrinibacteria bacterium CG10_big_fil_rev_8_21_14_0_10_54_7]